MHTIHTVARRTLKRVKDDVLITSLLQLIQKSKTLIVPRHCIISSIFDELKLSKFNSEYKIPETKIHIDTSLFYTIKIFNWFLPEDHLIYKTNKKHINNITVPDLVQLINTKYPNICTVVKTQEILRKLKFHVIQQTPKPDLDEENLLNPFESKVYIRTESCEMFLTNTIDICNKCLKYKNKQNQGSPNKKRRLSEPAKLKAPISKTDPRRVVLTLKNIGCVVRSLKIRSL